MVFLIKSLKYNRLVSSVFFISSSVYKNKTSYSIYLNCLFISKRRTWYSLYFELVIKFYLVSSGVFWNQLSWNNFKRLIQKYTMICCSDSYRYLSNSKLSIRSTSLTNNFTTFEMADIHIIRRLADHNSEEARTIHQNVYPNRIIPRVKTSWSLHARLHETERFINNCGGGKL